jgi:orotate phosphoribosyltransferase
MSNLDFFKESGALLDGHFQLTSGLHSPNYFQCALVLQHPKFATALCEQIAAAFENEAIDRVIAPAIGGIVVSCETGRLLGKPGIFAERKDGTMTLRRGFHLERGERVLVVEDVVTTGGSVQEVLDLVTKMGAIPVGVGVIVDRSSGRASFHAGEMPLPFFACYTQEVTTWTAEECPLCAEEMEIDKPGSRHLK